MADVGGGRPELVLKRCEAAIKRIEHSISQQELQLMEMEDQRYRIQENITASKNELKKAQENYEVNLKAYKQGVKSDG